MLERRPYRPVVVGLMIDSGKEEKGRAGDILGALTGDGGIGGHQVGKIDINDFAAYVAVGIACLLFCQVFINIGVNTGLLPTKGLTLPFFSYGGSSLLSVFAAMGLAGRVSYEVRVVARQGGSVKSQSQGEINA